MMAAHITNGEHQSTSWSPPALPPGYDKHHIVYLESVHLTLKEIPFPHTLEVYQRTAPEEIVERIKPATIVIANVCEIMPEHVDQAPHLQLLLILATGMAWVDKAHYAKRGITVMNTPGANVDAVSEHFLGLYFASRKRMGMLDHLTKTSDEWQKRNTLAKLAWPQGPSLGCKQEVLGIVGYGALGHRIEHLAKALDFKKVIIAERRGAQKIRPGRLAFDEVLERCTTVVCVCPRDADTLNLIDEPQLRRMRKDALLINIGRGGIINEAALAKALREGWIFGAATDVLDVEPSGPGATPLLPDLSKGEQEIPNLLITAHTAWYNQMTLENILNWSRDSMTAFVEGRILDPEVSHRIAVHEGRIWK